MVEKSGAQMKIKRWLSSNTFFLVLLLAISAYTWRLLPEQVIRGDGFVYLISETQRDFFDRDFFYTGFELSAVSFGWLFSRLYGINISWYWWIAYIIMLVTHAMFYALALTIFKKPILAFVASVIFALNYFGNWDIYSSHCYCFFLERIIPVLFLLPAAVYLHRFLEKGKRREGIFSIILYVLGVGLGHWSVFIAAFFSFYPVCWALFRRRKQVENWLLGTTFFVITIFFVLVQQIHESGLGPDWSAINFLFHPEVYLWPQKILHQFVYWTQYPLIVSHFYNLRRLQPETSDLHALEVMTPYIVTLYVLAFYMIFHNLPKYRALLVTAIIGTISIFYVNAFFGQYDVLYQPGANRYLYYPTMLLSLFWTLFIGTVINRREKLLKGIVVMIFIGYIVINIALVRESYIETMGHNAWTKKVYEYIQLNTWFLEKDTLIIAPYDEVGVYEAIFFTEQLSSRGVKVMSAYNTYSETSMWQGEASKSAHVLMLEKNKACRCIKEIVMK